MQLPLISKFIDHYWFIVLATLVSPLKFSHATWMTSPLFLRSSSSPSGASTCSSVSSSAPLRSPSVPLHRGETNQEVSFPLAPGPPLWKCNPRLLMAAPAHISPTLEQAQSAIVRNIAALTRVQCCVMRKSVMGLGPVERRLQAWRASYWESLKKPCPDTCRHPLLCPETVPKDHLARASNHTATKTAIARPQRATARRLTGARLLTRADRYLNSSRARLPSEPRIISPLKQVDLTWWATSRTLVDRWSWSLKTDKRMI